MNRFFYICVIAGLAVFSVQPCRASEGDTMYFSLDSGNTVLKFVNTYENLIGISLHMQLPKGVALTGVDAREDDLMLSKIDEENMFVFGLTSKNYSALPREPFVLKFNSPVAEVPHIDKLRLFQYMNNTVSTIDIVTLKKVFPLVKFIFSILSILIGIALILYSIFWDRVNKWLRVVIPGPEGAPLGLDRESTHS